MSPGVITIAVFTVFGFAGADAWRLGLAAGTAAAIAAIPAAIVGAAFLVAAWLNRRTGRLLLLQAAASSVAVVAIVAYGRQLVIGPGGPDGASQLHVVFLPLALGVYAAVVMALCAIAARRWPRHPATRSDR